MQSPDSLKVVELEKELETTKSYFNKRIREIEEKKGYKAPTADKDKKTAPADKDKKTAPADKKNATADVKSLEEKIDQLTKERNILA